MRLVRPFQLADPPSTDAASPLESVELPPVFPCEVIERPCSALLSSRPRQYGRRFSGFAGSSAESPLSHCHSTSSSQGTGALIWRQQSSESQSHYQNANVDVPTPSLPSADRSSLQNESVSNIVDTQLSTRSIPTSG